MTRIARYGSWKSPVTAELVSAKAGAVEQVRVDGGNVYWASSRPAEGGRTALVRRKAAGSIADVLPADADVKSRVNEYGGGDYAVQDGIVVWSRRPDQRLWMGRAGEAPRPLTPEGGWRYADASFDRGRDRVVCLREDHTAPGEPAQTIVGVPLDGAGAPRVLVQGHDFFFSPRVSPDGKRLAWIAWDHPRMPWDGTELFVAEIGADGAIGPATAIAGGPAESVVSPAWGPDGALVFASDRTGWWNLYRWDGRGTRALQPMEAEFAPPPWNSHTRWFDFLSVSTLVCAREREGRSRLATIDLATGAMHEIPLPFTRISDVKATPAGKVVLVAGSPTTSASVVEMDVATGAATVLAAGAELPVDEAFLSTPRPITFPTGGERTAHAWFYPPANRDFRAPDGERPPLVVMIHGGPTGAAYDVLDPKIQWFTSRGFAVVDVNYGGSTGYGRAYRERLRGRWGEVDVEDCVNAARWLAAEGLVDGNRLAIRGSSAGGYTTLAALTFHDVFKAGASLYGIGDLEALAHDTHKFEARYLDGLIGPYPAAKALYVARSPIHHVDRLSAPVIFFQGLDDKVVPPAQAEAMVAALRAKRLPVAHVTYEGEGHGFRKAENKRRTLEAELYFYARVFGFELADPVEPVPIENLG